MRLTDITEQLQRRKSPEELAALKAAPGYWKVGVRKEFNDLINKFGATSRENDKRKVDDATLNFDRNITVLVSGPTSLALHRDKRARALLTAIAKWLVAQTEKGRDVSIAYWGAQYGVIPARVPKGDAQKAHHLLTDLSRIEHTIDWLKQLGERGEKLPLKMDLRFTIALPKNE